MSLTIIMLDYTFLRGRAKNPKLSFAITNLEISVLTLSRGLLVLGRLMRKFMMHDSMIRVIRSESETILVFPMARTLVQL